MKKKTRQRYWRAIKRIGELLDDLSVKEQLIFLGHLAQDIEDRRKEIIGLAQLDRKYRNEDA